MHRLFDYSRGIARVRWPELAVELKFDLLRLERRTGEVSAELTTSIGSNGSIELLHRARLSLLSTRARDEVARHLAQRCAGADWPVLLESACWDVLEAYRRGRPAILLRDAKEPAADGWVLHPLMLRDDPVILFGDGGNAKSQLALAFAASAHSGRKLTPLQPAGQVRVAYLDFEWREWPHKKRLEALCGPNLPDLVYVPCQAEGPLSYQVDRLRTIFQEHRVEYAVLDSVALACAGPPEESSVALDFFQALGQLEVGSFLIAHVNRDGDTQKPFGSAFWHNSARATWYVKRVQEVGSSSLDLGLYNRKANDGPLEKPFGLRVDFGMFATTIGDFKLEDNAELDAQLPLKDRIRRLVEQAGTKTYKELGEHLESSADVIRKTVSRYPNLFAVEDSDEGKVVRAKGGVVGARHQPDTADAQATGPYTPGKADTDTLNRTTDRTPTSGTEQEVLF